MYRFSLTVTLLNDHLWWWNENSLFINEESTLQLFFSLSLSLSKRTKRNERGKLVSIGRSRMIYRAAKCFKWLICFNKYKKGCCNKFVLPLYLTNPLNYNHYQKCDTWPLCVVFTDEMEIVFISFCCIGWKTNVNCVSFCTIISLFHYLLFNFCYLQITFFFFEEFGDTFLWKILSRINIHRIEADQYKGGNSFQYIYQYQ